MRKLSILLSLPLFVINLFVFSFRASAQAVAPVKIAFIGDSGMGSNYVSVLNVIKNEGANAVVHLGDFDYQQNPSGFENALNSVLGSNFPYFYVVGNHDAEDADSWRVGCANSRGCYAQNFLDRMARIGINLDLSGGDNLTNREGHSMYSLDFRGIKIVSVGLGDFDNGASGVGNAVYTPYIRSKLAGDNRPWKICAWHMTQQEMQVGGKHDSMGWGVYDECRAQGAIIATAHEHSYHRTRTLDNMQSQIVDPVFSDPNNVRVEPGKSFVFVSAIGGSSIREQLRCTPTTFPYGCNNTWAKIYTSSQGARYGALFIEFNYQADPNRAYGYFKNIAGEIVDDFMITTSGASVPTQTASPTPTSTPQNYSADINQDGQVDWLDYQIIAENFFSRDPNPVRADINRDGLVDLGDYAVLVDGFDPASSPSPSSQPADGGRLYGDASPFNTPIPVSANYMLESRIGSIRPNYEDWSMPIYRIASESDHTALVNITNRYSGRTANWPIPSYAEPSVGADHHLGVIDSSANVSYEFWDFAWNSGRTAIVAGGFKDFPLSGSGISNPPNHRVTASGFAVSAGMVVAEDFTNDVGNLDPALSINHALSMSIPSAILSDTFVTPAVGAESKGVGDIPVGARFALPRNLAVDGLSLHPLTKAMARALRDYGVFVNDSNEAGQYQGKYVGTVRVEIGLTAKLFGLSNDALLTRVQSEMSQLISQYGLYRVL